MIELPRTQDPVLSKLHDEAQDRAQRELLEEATVADPGVEVGQAQPDPQEAVKSVVEPGQEAHHSRQIKQVVCDEHAGCDREVEGPETLPEIKLESPVAMAD